MLQFFICRANQACFDYSFGLIPYPRESSVLEKVQEFALQRQTEVGDLIQEQCPILGEFDSPRLG